MENIFIWYWPKQRVPEPVPPAFHSLSFPILVNDDGSMGAWNDVTTVGIEHKLGLHGSATCTLSFGENSNCLGWLVGDAFPVEGRGKGMAQMFRFMNEERLNTVCFLWGRWARLTMPPWTMPKSGYREKSHRPQGIQCANY